MARTTYKSTIIVFSCLIAWFFCPILSHAADCGRFLSNTSEALKSPDNLLTAPLPKSFKKSEELAFAKLIAIDTYTPLEQKTRLSSIDENKANQIFKKISEHPVTSLNALEVYDPNCDLGLCFGRSAAYYLEALASGIAKDSIKKIIMVGQFGGSKRNEIVWKYHMATMIKASDDPDNLGSWWVMDPSIHDSEPVRLFTWYLTFEAHFNHGRPFNLFITNAKRVIPSDPKPLYLDFRKVEDRQDAHLIKRYFKDYLQYLRNESHLRALGK